MSFPRYRYPVESNLAENQAEESKCLLEVPVVDQRSLGGRRFEYARAVVACISYILAVAYGVGRSTCFLNIIFVFVFSFCAYDTEVCDTPAICNYY